MSKSKTQSPATVIGVAWYKADQWQLLRDLSADREKLEDSYEEWLVEAERVVKKLRQSGLRVVKVEIEIADLVFWCENQKIEVNGESRSKYAVWKLQSRIAEKQP